MRARVLRLSMCPLCALRSRPSSRCTPRVAPYASSWTAALACRARHRSTRATLCRAPSCAWTLRGAAKGGP
eukprot:8933868-Lingulodinium_polyedra.AAC.1